MRSRPLLLCLLPLFFACGDDDTLSETDAGADAGVSADGSASDAGSEDTGPASDAGVGRDAAAPRDAGPQLECDPLATPTSSTAFARVNGLISVLEFYTWADNQMDTFHWRQWQVGAFSAELEASVSEPALFRGIPEDGCITVNLPAPSRDLRPFRNIGTRLDWTAESGDAVVWNREDDGSGPVYRLPSGPIGLKFSDPAQTPFDQRWTWSTPGDEGALIRPASAEIMPVEDFQVTPALASGPDPVELSAGTEIQWTAPTTTPGWMTLTLGRSTDPSGAARAVICHPADDGSFTITQAMLDALAPTPGVAFSFDVSRSQSAAFCNEGVTEGVAQHIIAHLGAAVVN